MPLDVINPYDQSLLCRVEFDEGDRLETKLASAHAAYNHWQQVPIENRIASVQVGLSRFREKSTLIARDVSQQMGKPIAQAQREVETVFELSLIHI